MIGLMLGWLGKSALMASPVGAYLRRVPKHVWLKLVLILAILAAAAVVYRWHNNKIEALAEASYAEGKADAYAAIEAAAAAVQTKSVEISSEIRSKTDEANAAVIVHADVVRVRGPGKAAAHQCGAKLGLPAGGPVPAAGQADAAVGGVPDTERADLIVVPFADLIQFAKEHDLDLNEVKAWRENQAKQSELVVQTNQ